MEGEGLPGCATAEWGKEDGWKSEERAMKDRPAQRFRLSVCVLRAALGASYRLLLGGVFVFTCGQAGRVQCFCVFLLLRTSYFFTRTSGEEEARRA